MMHGQMMDGWWWGHGGLWWLAVVLGVLVVVAVVVVVLVSVLGRGGSGDAGGPSPQSGAGPTPREVLDARYARGEIDRDAYLQARRDLDDPPA